MLGRYDKSGNRISRAAHFRLFCQGEAYKRIAQDFVPAADGGEAVLVSTIWTGNDVSGGRGAPIIFETMIRGGVLDEQFYGASTEDEAKATHALALARAVEAETAARLT